MAELPIIHSIFEPPQEQAVSPGQPNDYVGVYLLRAWVTITLSHRKFGFGKVERWRPVFECDLPSELKGALSSQRCTERYFAIWFTGVPSESGRIGLCNREVRITHIAKTLEGRDLRQEEYEIVR